MVEQPPDHLAGGVETWNGLLTVGDDAAPGVDLDAAKGEADAAGHGVAGVRRGVDGLGPVALGRGDAHRAPSVLDGRVVRNIGLHRRVELFNRLDQPGWVDVQTLGQFLDGVGLGHRHLVNMVFVPQQVLHFLVEDLEAQALGLSQQGPPVGDVGVVAEVGALVQEALTVDVHDQSKGIGVLLVQLGDGTVAEGRGVHVPGHGVATAVVAVGLGAHVQGHLDAVAGVVGDAPDLDHLPARSQIAAAHLGVGLETPGGQHHRAGGDVLEAVGSLDRQAAHPALLVLNEFHALSGVPDVDTHLATDIELLVGQALSCAHGLDQETAPEPVFVADFEGLPAVGQDEPDPFRLEPLHCRQRLADQYLGQLRVA